MLLDEKPVLAHTVAGCLETGLFDLVVVVVAPGEEDLFRRWVVTPFFHGEERLVAVVGGEERQKTVFNGLLWLEQQGVEKDRVVCIHDGARPLLDKSLAWQGYQEALSHGAAVPGIPLKDTVKEVDDAHNVLRTPSRERLLAVQTPQCFRFSLLWQAHREAEKDGFKGSDDASLVERMGKAVKVFPGSESNIKLTTPLDFKIAEILLASSGSSRKNNDRGGFGRLDQMHCR